MAPKYACTAPHVLSMAHHDGVGNGVVFALGAAADKRIAAWYRHVGYGSDADVSKFSRRR